MEIALCLWKQLQLTPQECTEEIFDSPPFMYNKIFLKKTFIEVGSQHLYPSFGTFCAQIGQLLEGRGTVNLWSIFENLQIAVIEGKCPRFRNSSKCLKIHCSANNWPIWNQGTKRSVKMRSTNFYKRFFKNILLYRNGGLAKIRSLHTYVIHRMFYFERYFTFRHCT